MIPLKSLLTEGKRINIPIKTGAGKESVSFTYMVGRDQQIIFMASSSKDLDKLQDIISDSKFPTLGVQKAIREWLEKKLKIPFIFAPDYPGAGYAFSLDFWGLIDKI
jgi:hypothetical protein